MRYICPSHFYLKSSQLKRTSSEKAGDKLEGRQISLVPKIRREFGASGPEARPNRTSLVQQRQTSWSASRSTV